VIGCWETNNDPIGLLRMQEKAMYALRSSFSEVHESSRNAEWMIKPPLLAAFDLDRGNPENRFILTPFGESIELRAQYSYRLRTTFVLLWSIRFLRLLVDRSSVVSLIVAGRAASQCLCITVLLPLRIMPIVGLLVKYGVIRET